MLQVLLISAALAAPDVSALTPAQRGIYEKVVTEEFCHCNSALTLSGCLSKRPDCALADDLGRLVFLSAQSGVSSDDILGYLSERVMGPYCAKAQSFNTKNAPGKGPANAELVVVEFADFRCGHCRSAYPLLRQAAKQHSKDARFVFMPFPLSNNAESLAAAEAALAAAAQGKFWEMHDALFDNQDRGFERAELRRLAKLLRLDVQRFERALDAHTYRQQVLDLKQQGLDAGVEGTPAFFVNGRPYELDPILMTFTRRFEMERHRNRGKCQ